MANLKKKKEKKKKRGTSRSHLIVNGYRNYQNNKVAIAINNWAQSYEPKIPEEIMRNCLISQCKLCNKQFDHKKLSQQTHMAITHYFSKAHATQAQRAFKVWQTIDKSNRKLPQLKKIKSSLIIKNFTCTICKCTCNSEVQMEMHLVSNKHKENQKNYVPSKPNAFHVFT